MGAPSGMETALPGATGFSEAELRAIVARASTLEERLESAFEPETDASQDDVRLHRWCQVVSKGDRATFAKRLAWDGLDLDQARRAVRPVRMVATAPLPAWTRTLNACVAAVETGEPSATERFLDAEAPVPFEDLLASFVQVGREAVGKQLAGVEGHVAPEALGQLERGLLKQLSALCAQALQVHFSVYTAFTFVTPGTLGASGDGAPPAADAAYRAFVRAMRTGELRAFLAEYSVLARLAAICVDNWAAATSRFLRRLHADRRMLHRHFAGEDPGPVTRVEGGLSDLHGGGDSARVVQWASGLRVVYKPKSLGPDVAFHRFLAWCNDRGFTPGFRSLKVLDRGAYGWVEFVATAECQHEEEARRYFQRTGALICVAHVLNGKDLHHENLIACGEHPVLIDLENIMVPPLDQGAAESEVEEELFSDQIDLENSVLGTALLPSWMVDASRPDEKLVFDVGGLGDETVKVFRAAEWTAINTDQMRMVVRQVESAAAHNVPQLKGTPLRTADYLDEVLAGFEGMYRTIHAHRDALMERGGALAAFADLKVRYVFRNTNLYGRLQRKLWHPRYLQDGADRAIELEALTRGYLTLAERPPYWPVIKAEQADLNRQDIPFFATSTTSRILLNARGDVLGTCFRASGYDAVREKLAALGHEDMALQQGLIRTAFYARQVEGEHEGVTEHGPVPEVVSSPEGLTVAMARATADEIAARLHRSAFRSDNGDVSWITMAFNEQVERFVIQRMGLDVHQGRAGVALFLAAHHRVAQGGGEERPIIEGTLRPLVGRLEAPESRQKLASQHPIGATMGLGSFVYALTRVGVLLGDDRFFEVAREAARLITPDKIDQDRRYDVVFGAAGAVLALLAFYRETGDEEALEAAIRCGQHLLKHRTVDPASGLRAWQTKEDLLKSGLAHGASGIAHALAELYRTTGDASCLEAALEAFAFERTLFVASVDNWYPSPPRTQQEAAATDKLWTAWCNGAAGIGLVRAANLDLYTANERRDLEAATRAVQRQVLSGIDYICCGVMGRIGFLAVAGEALGRPDLSDAASQAAAGLVARAQQQGGFRLTADGRDELRQSYLQGLSGIGYELLHLTHPGRVPSALLFR